MVECLTTESIRYAMNQLEKGKMVSVVAAELKVTPRYIRRLRAEFRETGSVHVPRLPGRPILQPPSQEEVQMVLDAYQLEKVGVLRTMTSLRRAGHNISYQRVYRIMKENGLVVPSEAKSRKRKWVRYERKHSNSMWHTDWHVMKGSAHEEASSRHVPRRCLKMRDRGRSVHPSYTSENVVVVLQQAIRQFGTPATILSDNVYCFVGMRGGNSKVYWKPTAFEEALLGRALS